MDRDGVSNNDDELLRIDGPADLQATEMDHIISLPALGCWLYSDVERILTPRGLVYDNTNLLAKICK